MTAGRINIIDATPIEAARISGKKNQNKEETRDADAGWHKKIAAVRRPQPMDIQCIQASMKMDLFTAKR